MSNEPTTFSVSELAGSLKKTVETAFGEVRVKGEVGKVTRHGSGHIYFDLKDESAVLHGAWFGAAKRNDSKVLEMGAEVVVRGRITTYAARSEYQIIVTSVELAGVGALLKLIEDRRKKLAAEGLFGVERKKKLLFLPKRIGIITSPTGAVIHDILHRLEARFMPHVLLWPVKVQGETAADEARAAIEGFNGAPPDLRPDIIILARGGGSVEDLMPFNDEALVRAVAASSIPIISAIGHETDWTLVDYAADVRAPTPTGAAEMAVPVKGDLVAGLMDLERRLAAAVARFISQQRVVLEGLRRGMPRPEALVQMAWQKLDDRSSRLSHALRRVAHDKALRLSRLALPHPREKLAQARLRLAGFSGMLETLSYRRTLERGYAVVMDGAGKVVSRVKDVPLDFSLELADGKVKARKN